MGLLGIHVSVHLPLHTLEQSEDLQIGITGIFGMSQTYTAVHFCKFSSGKPSFSLGQVRAQKHCEFVWSSMKQTQQEQQHLPIQIRDGCKSAADDDDGSLVW